MSIRFTPHKHHLKFTSSCAYVCTIVPHNDPCYQFVGPSSAISMHAVFTISILYNIGILVIKIDNICGCADRPGNKHIKHWLGTHKGACHTQVHVHVHATVETELTW